MIKAVIFDYNGVIKKINKYFFDDVELIFGLSSQEKQDVKKATRDLFEQLDKGLLDEDSFWVKFSQCINKKMPSDVKEQSRKLFNEHFELYQEVVNMVKNLKNDGYVTAVLSDTFPYMAEITRERNGYDYFDKVYLSCEVGFVKPQKEFYELVVKDLNARPDECIFIDDSEGNLLPAKEMGMKIILAKSPEQIVEDIWSIVKSENYATTFLGKVVKIKIDRPIGSKHPTHDFIYEVNYGFVPETKAPDGEEIDAYVLGVNKSINEFTGKCIAVIHRLNDDDDKLVVVSEDYKNITDEEILKATNFQEKWFKIEIIR